MKRAITCSSVITRAPVTPSPLGRRTNPSILFGMAVSAFTARHPPAASPSVATWQAHEPVDLVRHADERVHRLAVARARQLQRDGEAEIGNERERMRRVDGERREQREDLPKEVIFEPRLFFLGHLGSFDQHDSMIGQHLPQLAPALLLVARKRSDGLADPGDLVGRGGPIPAPSCALSPATRTMKNSSRLLAEIDRNRTRSSKGWASVAASSRTRLLNCSLDNSRLITRSGVGIGAG